MRAVGADEEGRVVPGVGVAQGARAVVVEREEERDEAVRVRGLVELRVDVGRDLRDRAGAVNAGDAARRLDLRRAADRGDRRALGRAQPLGQDRGLRAGRLAGST